MQRDVVIVDDFYENPDAVVRYAHSRKYYTPYNAPDDEAKGRPVLWRTSEFRSGTDCSFKSSLSLIAKLEFLVGEQINLDHWYADFPLGADGLPRAGYEKVRRTTWWNCCFHARHQAQEPGDGIHSYIEADPWNSVGAMGWSGIVYLAKGPARRNGIMTWKNRHGRRYDRFTPREHWELVDEYAFVYNRLLLLRGYIPRSISGGWGRTLSDGAFFQTFFFTTLLPDAMPSVSLHDVPMPFELIRSLRLGPRTSPAHNPMD